MAYFTCKCGTEIPLKTNVERHLAKLVDSKFLIEDFPAMLDKLEDIEAKPPWISEMDAKIDFIIDVIGANARDVIFCENCERLWLQERSSQKFIPYIQEDN